MAQAVMARPSLPTMKVWTRMFPQAPAMISASRTEMPSMGCSPCPAPRRRE